MENIFSLESCLVLRDCEIGLGRSTDTTCEYSDLPSGTVVGLVDQYKDTCVTIYSARWDGPY